MIKVLLVDDDKHLQTVYKTLFDVSDFEVIAQAFDGVEALDVYSEMETKPDVVLMDQRMPRMDGITATRELRDLNPDIKVVFLSADIESRNNAFRAGASAFLSKPVRIEILFETIENVFNDTSVS